MARNHLDCFCRMASEIVVAGSGRQVNVRSHGGNVE